ncbi:MAG: hypothetical protein JWR00_1481 [Rubritepida sp.]|nr:hypothetical protein [Rubritepida sp.]
MSGTPTPTSPGERNGLPAASGSNIDWLRNEEEAIKARGEPTPRRVYRQPIPFGADQSNERDTQTAQAATPEPIPYEKGSYAGLALSGGGIRSASVCLGVLQALDRGGLLKDFGWLSTVSGGGYTGLGWLAHAFKAGKGFPYGLPEAAGTPLRRLRDRASYLKAPGCWPGLIAAGALLRKLLANIALLAPLVLILAGLMGVLHAGWAGVPGEVKWWLSLLSWAALFAMVLAATEALRQEGLIGAHERIRSDRIAARVLISLFILAAAVALARLPDWSRSVLLHVPDFIQSGSANSFVSLVGSVAGLLGAGAIASRMKGRFATLGLTIIGVLFLLALLALAVVIVHRVEEALQCCEVIVTEGKPDQPPVQIGKGLGTFVVLALAGAATLTVIASRIDANALSLHGYYRDRLKSTFFPTGPAPPLSALMPVDTRGPLPVVNATVAGTYNRGMSRRGRPAGPFTLTPFEAGSQYLGYVATASLEGAQQECDAATAMALSAAAVSPQAGRVTGGRVAVFFKALLNARTGRWMPAPRHVKSGAPVPRPNGWYALKEMFGSFTSLSRRPLVFVSDGGHWENLGVLSLVHRHCPLILAVDAEADPEMGFNGLGIATMLSRLDAGTELQVCVDKLRHAPGGQSADHFAIGTLDYPDGKRGTLLYVKATLSGDEPSDVLTYAAANPTFPHETTADQFFSEAQFEAYRALGQHIGERVITHLKAELDRLA